jgi:hypothetical protein
MLVYIELASAVKKKARGGSRVRAWSWRLRAKELFRYKEACSGRWVATAGQPIVQGRG